MSLPFITIVGATIPTLFAGSVILELLFSLPGMGRYLVNAALNYDYNVVMTTTMFFAIITLSTQLLTDLSYAWFDPRVSYGAKPLTLVLTLGVLTGLTSCDRLGWSASACFPAGPPPHGGATEAESESVQFLEGKRF
jgi:Binding-protein-dependent transport system inner membrane component